MASLEGILVVSIEQAVAAPLCTARLVEAGARVIKIERAGGDFARKYDSAAFGESSYFAWINGGKESIVLDFKNNTDAALLHRMIAKADVFIQNLAPGAMDRSGFGSEDLRKIHPSLITCDISGYGLEGPASKLKAYDLLVQAESGLVSISGAPGEPGRIGVSICDIGAGMTAHAGVLDALLDRYRTGVGKGISVSLFDVAADWMNVPWIHHTHGEGAPARVGLKHPSIAPYGSLPTRDDLPVLISIQNEREWKKLCLVALKALDIFEDPDFSSNNSRVANRDCLEIRLAEITSQLNRSELIIRLQEADIAFGCLNTVAEFANHDALRHRSVKTADGRNIKLIAHPVIKSDAKDYELTLPSVDQHGAQIRQEFKA